jgi:ATP-binding cassette, subfamily F, member 3
MISKANFLLLDEPTNHLDIHSCELLIEALNKYEGSYILVSHDRYFVSKTANKIWEIDNGQIKEFKGGYEEWVAWKERMAEKEKTASSRQDSIPSLPDEENKEIPAGTQKPNLASGRDQDAVKTRYPLSKSTALPTDPKTAINKEVKKEYQKQKRLFQQLEVQINELKSKKSVLETALTDPAVYAEKNRFVQAENDYKKAAAELDQANRHYEQVFEMIIELEKDLTS